MNTVQETAAVSQIDRVRASYFGLRLPETPVKTVAPARVPLTWEESLEVNRARNEALHQAESIERRPATQAFAIAAVAEAEARQRVLARREESRPEPAPAPSFGPSPEDDAEDLGYRLGYAGINAAAPSSWTIHVRAAFYEGLADGQKALQDETEEFEAWIDEIERNNPEMAWHESESRRATCLSGFPAN